MVKANLLSYDDRMIETTVMAQPIKQTAQEILDNLPADASWEDLLYRLVERREIELGLADSDAGRTTPVEVVMEEFGVKPE